ncbi:MAG: dihydroorotate dehydrogenase [Caldilineaceae bacterium]|nr:dihydroorotate dehydrogenase [Caldilineaceae bacterium]
METRPIDFLGHSLHSPFVLASGIWGTTASLLQRAAQAGCGAVTAKSCGPTPRTGHVNPTCLDWGNGLINAIGLANPGVENEVGLLEKARPGLDEVGVPLIASIFAGTAAEFGQVAATIAQARPALIEVNISCPNVHSEFGEPFAANATSAAEVTTHVKAVAAPLGIPVIVKLAPNVPSVTQIAHAVIEAGADAFCAINTMPGLVLDVESGQPILANISGGISGPALKPIALKCVFDLHRAFPHIPIIGTGGVTTGRDALEMVMAGATLVGIGSAIYYRGPNAISEIRDEFNEWLACHHITDLAEIRGRAHRAPVYPTVPTGAPIPHAH